MIGGTIGAIGWGAATFVIKKIKDRKKAKNKYITNDLRLFKELDRFKHRSSSFCLEVGRVIYTLFCERRNNQSWFVRPLYFLKGENT